MLTEKDYCDYDTCVALREIGCRTKTEWYIHQPSYERGSCYLCFGIPRTTSVLDECDYIPRLSLYEAQKWLREEKKIGVFVSGFKNGYTFWVYNLLIGYTLYQGFFDNQTGQKYKSYEEALLEGIKEAIKLLKEEK